MSEHHRYPKDSAGRAMTALVPRLSGEATVGEARRLLERSAASFDTIDYVYLLNEARTPIGVVSVHEILEASEGEKLRTLSTERLITVRPHTSQERVAHLALRANIKAMPVVSARGEFLGVVPSDAILAILSREHTKDILRLAGIKHAAPDPVEHLLSPEPFVHFRARLPWLVLGLLGGIAAALVVERFEHTLEAELLLAAFIPAIVYMADAVGAQTQMLFVRTLAVDHNFRLRNYFGRELIVNLMLGLALALLIAAISFGWWFSPVVSAILGLSIFLTVCATVFIAILLPWFLHARGYDPAIASGPLATVVRDILSLCIYLLVATALLSLV
jgi:magnesium transporter